MSYLHQRQEWLREVAQENASAPARPELDLRIIHKRPMFGYEEWRIEYQAYDAATMPFPAGQRIPAYLLIPSPKRTLAGKTHYSDAHAYEPPFPAAVCFHQCCVDCDLGKEAVVGKAVDRPDQAYGLELVRSGFVVLAPDSVWCGERHVVPGRAAGERIHCIDGLRDEPRYQQLMDLARFDGVRAVDLLESLEFVDSGRIAAVGHSGGGCLTVATMARDPRVRAGITSGWVPTLKQLACIAPRLLTQLLGTYEEPEDLSEMRRVHEAGAQVYEELGVPENLELHLLEGGHAFLDAFKWRAYARLKRHFGMDSERERLLVDEVLRCALESVAWAWEDFAPIPIVHGDGRGFATANRQTLEGAFRALLLVLSHRMRPGASLTISIAAEADLVQVSFSIPGGWQDVRGAMDHYGREAERLIVENDGTLGWEPSAQGLRRVVRLPRAA